MKVSKLALLALKGRGPAAIARLSKATGASEPTIYRWIQTESDNLTKAAALEVIQEETGLTREQILVSVEEAETR